MWGLTRRNFWKVFLLFILMGPSPLLALEVEPVLENTAIVQVREEEESGLYDRLRLKATVTDERLLAWSGVLILDSGGYYLPEKGEVEGRVKINRGYLQYAGAKHFLVAGLQRVPFGVGRIWNPIDQFNPIDVLSIEPEERPGTEALRYEYAVNALSNFDATVAVDKAAARLKSFQSFADVALVGVVDDDKGQEIIGWEVQGELFATGIELRSEGGFFHEREPEQHYVEAIVGGEYSFANSLTLLVEFLYNDDTHLNNFGLTAGYQLTMLWTINLLVLGNPADHSGCLAPSFNYSLADDMTLSGGVFHYFGGPASQYGDQAETLYLRWFVNF